MPKIIIALKRIRDLQQSNNHRIAHNMNTNSSLAPTHTSQMSANTSSWNSWSAYIKQKAQSLFASAAFGVILAHDSLNLIQQLQYMFEKSEHYDFFEYLIGITRIRSANNALMNNRTNNTVNNDGKNIIYSNNRGQNPLETNVKLPKSLPPPTNTSSSANTSSSSSSSSSSSRLFSSLTVTNWLPWIFLSGVFALRFAEWRLHSAGDSSNAGNSYLMEDSDGMS